MRGGPVAEFCLSAFCVLTSHAVSGHAPKTLLHLLTGRIHKGRARAASTTVCCGFQEILLAQRTKKGKKSLACTGCSGPPSIWLPKGTALRLRLEDFLKRIQKQPEILAKALADRHSDLTIETFQEIDAVRRKNIAQVEELKSRRNAASQEVARMKREGQDASALLAELSDVSDRIKELDAKTDEAIARLEEWMLSVPNIPDASVPVGKDETENVEIRRVGTPRDFDFEPLPHWDVGTRLKGLDFERAVRMSGSRYVVSLGWAARLDRALVNFFLDVHTKEEDYIEVQPPAIVTAQTLTGTAQLPKFEEDLYKLREGTYLIPTAEVPLTNLHAQEVLAEEDLPRAYTAATPCFRSEAGSAGKDTRGLIRMHQFTKVA